MLHSQFIPSSPSPAVSTSLFSMSASLFLPCRQVHQYHFSRFHIYAFTIRYLFFCFLLHSVKQALGSSTSVQLTYILSFLWLSNIPLYICATVSSSVHLLTDIQVSFISWLFSIMIFSGYMPSSGIAGSQQFYSQFLKKFSYSSPQWLYQFTFPPTVQEGSLFFTSSPAFTVCRFFWMMAMWYEVTPHCSFDSHFSNKK